MMNQLLHQNLVIWNKTKYNGKFMNLALNILSFISLLVFIFFAKFLSNSVILVFFAFWVFIIQREIFSYIYFYKIAKNRAFYKKFGFLMKLFSGKNITQILSFFSAFILAFSLILNFLNLSKLDFVFIFIILPTIFIFFRIFTLKILKNELKNPILASKKWLIIITAIVAVFLNFFINLAIYDKQEIINLNFFEFINSLNPNSVFNSSIINEIYVYSFYIDGLNTWLANKFSIFILLFLSINKFIFFVAILHIFSSVFNKKVKIYKFGYFINTILILFYIYLIFFLAFKLEKIGENLQNKETWTQKSFEFILKTGEKITLDLQNSQKLVSDINQTTQNLMQNTVNSVNNYIDGVFDSSAKMAAKKIGDFNYSAFSDYLVLWHSVIDGDSTTFLNDKFNKFLNESFPTNFNENIEQIIALNIEKYEKDLNLIFKNIDNKIDFNITNVDFMQNKMARVQNSGIGASFVGGGIALKMATKMLAKTNAKLAASATAGESGVICGTGAIVCVPALAVATWFGFDYLFAKGDEMINRDDFERQIYDEIVKNKIILKNSLNSEIKALFNNFQDNIFIR